HRSGPPRQTENNPPHDFAGGTVSTANPFDAATLSPGPHIITVVVDLTAGGSEVVSATFTVAGATPALLWTPDPVDLSVIEGGSTTRQVNLNTTTGTAQYTAASDASWLAAAPAAGTTPAALTLTANAAGLAPGTYTGTATATAPGYASDTLTVRLTVGQPAPPDQIHLAWVGDPATTLTVVWRTADPGAPSAVEYRTLGAAMWQSASGGLRPSGTSGTLHEVTLTGLTASTSYEYRVSGPASTWSPVFRTRTAPPRGPAGFDAIYVADTGLVGRLDGLATGTQQVVDEIAALNPLLVLGGGDYAYFDTDRRFGTLDNTIDAWFNQMQPVAARSPLMPTYGNHEVLLGEGFDAWAARFATPAGFNNRRNYSFDVGDVHFVSIHAVGDGGLSGATLAWIEQDIAAAHTAGQRWIIPYFHVSPFADGRNHPSNLSLRAQLGPLFERLGVQLAIASHDQAYERSYPLVDVPATNMHTSTSKRCYTANDGVTWVKVSPGGKLSNINLGFSQFATEPPPPWTAARDNVMHHFARLTVSAGGTIRLDAYGVIGDGTPPLIVDTFQYTLGSCPPELAFDRGSLAVAAAEGESASAQVGLAATDGATAYTAGAGATWLTVSPGTGTTPRVLTVNADAAGLSPGIHTATITATAPGHLEATLPVTLSVGAEYELRLSTRPDRGDAVPLEGASVSGHIYVFVAPPTEIVRVRFYVDNPNMVGPPRQTENAAPWDLAGTASGGAAHPFDTNGLASGAHTLTVVVDRVGAGSEIVHATFTVANASSAHTLLVSTAPNRSNPVELDGSTARGVIYVFVSPSSGASRVRFFIDDENMTGSPDKVELFPPWDLAGTAANGVALPFDSTMLAEGLHTLTAAIDLAGGGTAVIDAVFTVANGAALTTRPDVLMRLTEQGRLREANAIPDWPRRHYRGIAAFSRRGEERRPAARQSGSASPWHPSHGALPEANGASGRCGQTHDRPYILHRA
ncbi:MAG: purple acid phosphatase family protein, partial [Candidatus Rokuibacteriota bacterium]